MCILACSLVLGVGPLVEMTFKIVAPSTKLLRFDATIFNNGALIDEIVAPNCCAISHYIVARSNNIVARATILLRFISQQF